MNESTFLIIERGDWIRFSVALLRQIYEEPGHVSPVVEVVEIGLDSDDGSKLIVLKRRDPTTWNQK